MPPSLVIYKTPEEYFSYYKENYSKQEIFTADGIRVFFNEGTFWHAFCDRDSRGKKTTFSFPRAKYIDWIKSTVIHPSATKLLGWIKDTQQYDATRRVAIVHGPFMVVLQMKISSSGVLCARFVTAFYCDPSTIKKVLSAPEWDRENCLKELEQKKE